MIIAGDKLVYFYDLVSDSGQILINKGDVVTVREVIIKEGHWSTSCPDIYIPATITGILLEEIPGMYRVDSFEK